MRYLLTSLWLCGFYEIQAQYPCENGLAEGKYPCNQMTMLAHLSPSDLDAHILGEYYLNDIWGWTDPETKKEYAIVGLVDGVIFIDVTIPTEPIILGRLMESLAASGRQSSDQAILHGKSYWRDIKTFKNHAFIVSDLNDEHSGLQVFDLTKLRNHDGITQKLYTEDASYDNFNRAHNIAINEATGYAYIVGSRTGTETCNAGLHVVNINEPKSPQFAGCFGDDGYTHDTQCVIYKGPDTNFNEKEICFCANENSLTIVDVEDKSQMNMVSRTAYDRVTYAHQGWLSEDHRFFIMNDELDEEQYGFTPRTLIWNVENLNDPILIGEYYNNAKGIDHNLYTHQNMVFESNYESGLRVLDMDQVSNGKLREIAFFDTYPQSDDIDFAGTWSNYPYFESGTIVVSDMVNGLFILKLELSEDIFTSQPSDVNVCGQNTIEFSLETNTSNLNYQWQGYDKVYYNLLDGDGISGALTNKMSVPITKFSEGDIIRCKITDESGREFYSYPITFNLDVPLATSLFTFNSKQESETVFEITFTNQSINADSFEWDFGDGETSTAENPSHQYSPGSYVVNLKAINSCDTAISTQNIDLLLLSTNLQSKISIFPNPAKSTFVISGNSTGEIKIYDLSGQIKSVNKITSEERMINIVNLQKGLYFVEFNDTANDTTQKFKLIKD